MLIIKLIYHINAAIAKLFYKIVYGSGVTFGKRVTWRKHLSLMIAKGAKLTVGDRCFFNNYCSVNVNNRITIGKNCMFGENVKIYDHNHRFSSADKPFNDQGFSNGEVHIGENCWIGSNVVILKGTVIGKNCVIGAGAVIKGTVPDNTVVKPTGEYVFEKIRVKGE
ncbi:MAG: acyltransferase [Ruminococcaceae bacterium]|nr:acyltransferase [Oscillospiraceae bacterium]